MSRFPFEYAKDWHVVSYSDELARSEVKAIRYFGRDLVIFRTEGGQASVLDAYCPHLGAHLGIGGTVAGESIQCPFHHWQYGTDGRCVHVPRAHKIPAKAVVPAWPVIERNGWIAVWYHPDRKDPEFDLPAIKEWGNPAWSERYTKFRWEIRTHPQDIMENTADFEHFMELHGAPQLEERIQKIDGTTLHWGLTYRLTDGPAANGRFLIEGDSWGLGCGPNYIDTGTFKVVAMAGATPIDEERTELRLGFLIPREVKADANLSAAAEAYMQGHTGAIDQDVPIWENKLYRPKPVLSDVDGPIGAYRKWARQFYAEVRQ
ncbi:MAG: Rieske 2Fe-2S domain-containing protein [Candidatus Binatus sp.]|uniref:Rieske 2Fe-2S domain-containing protein n=1 Tax=Candidatus Binatus sp. TaxID=2811406 RepID=UPI002721AE10|nr:Rieske 2Fe-2S domain-containing protein [Candidatus Binatus sp.]MDO8431190.1 Rieske 2Fe-2S domain-containing protein [Candidatus Binatus sp.]